MIKLRRFEDGRWCDVFVCASSVKAVASGGAFGADVLIEEEWVRGISGTPEMVSAMVAGELSQR